MLVLGCSESDDSSGCNGSSATQRCDINADATVCGERITVECFDGATPDSKSQCDKAIEEDDESIYCCVNAVEEAALEDGGDLSGGGGS